MLNTFYCESCQIQFKLESLPDFGNHGSVAGTILDVKRLLQPPIKPANKSRCFVSVIMYPSLL